MNLRAPDSPSDASVYLQACPGEDYQQKEVTHMLVARDDLVNGFLSLSERVF